MINLKINNKEYQVDNGITLIQACANVGIEIPRFCYHEKLSIAGNCRMCLVEISNPKGIKPAASCALPVSENMHIHTNTIMVKKARESVLEFLLINHPLDCPICDQGGECDLQDQTIVFGSDRGRFYDDKRSVADKECGPFIKTVMTRCIHCTRCVRFGNEIAGVDFLGTTGRGSNTEISQYVSNMIESELSGNIIDLCPVGALTSKSYAYMARSWELSSVETIDILDSLCSNIRVDSRGLNVLRILPRLNEGINEEWLTDKSRFSYDAFNLSRLHYPLIKFGRNLIPVSWDSAFLWIGFQIFEKKIKNSIGYIGNLVDSESILSLKYFLNKFNNSFFFIENIKNFNIDFRKQYLLNISLINIENVDLIVLIGLNPRLELPLLNVRIRKAVKNNNTLVYTLGFHNNLTYFSHNISNNIFELIKFIEGKSFLCRKFIRSSFPLILMGNATLERFDSFYITNLIPTLFRNIFKNKYKNSWFNIVIRNVGSINSFELGLSSEEISFNKKINNSLLYMLGVSKLSLISNLTINSKNLIKIYQGHTGSMAAEISDIILPGSSYVETKSLFLNLEGKVQQTNFVKVPPGLSRTDWKIISALSIFIGKSINLDSLYSVRTALKNSSPIFNYINVYENYNLSNFSDISIKKIYEDKFIIYNSSFVSSFFDSYLNNTLSSVSRNMSRASKRFVIDRNFVNIQ